MNSKTKTAQQHKATLLALSNTTIKTQERIVYARVLAPQNRHRGIQKQILLASSQAKVFVQWCC